MILIALGANLPSRAGAPIRTLPAALHFLDVRGAQVCGVSHYYRSAPIPPSGQPDFVNAVARIKSDLDPWSLLALLHETEAAFGRQRKDRWEARTLDLDLIDYHQFVTTGAAAGQEEGGMPLVLPHPRLDERAFVLCPLMDVAPSWRHPRSGRLAGDLFAALSPPQDCTVLAD